MPPEPPRRPLRIGVIGGGRASPEEARRAEALGAALADRGAWVLCGGRGGVMEAASRGCHREGGVAVGILPGRDAHGANPWVALPLATGLGEARNALVVRGAEAVVAVAGGWGTLSEIALARKMDRPVALLGPGPVEGLDLPRFRDASEAAEWAVDEARTRRSEPAPDPGRRG